MDVLAVDARNGEADEAVVDEDGAAHVDLARELQVVEVEVLGSAQALLGGLGRGDRDLGARRQLDLGVALEQAGADLGALGVEQDAHGGAELPGDALDALHAHMVLLVAAVAEVEAGDVHARLHHLAQRIVVIARRSHGADDLGSLNQHSKLRSLQQQLAGLPCSCIVVDRLSPQLRTGSLKPLRPCCVPWLKPKAPPEPGKSSRSRLKTINKTLSPVYRLARQDWA